MTYNEDEFTQPDAVRPLDEGGLPIEPELRPAPTPRRPWVAFAGTAAVVLLVGAVGAWLWWANVIRGPLGAAEVLPGSADVVFTVDALELIESDRFMRFVEAFDPDDEFEFDIDEIIREADDELEDATGLRLLSDATEWIGRSAAVAVWVPGDLLTSVGPPDVDVAIAVMTRNEGRAREFVEDVVAAANREGADIDLITIADVEVYSVPSDTVPALVTVHSGRVLLANDPGRMAEMIDPDDPITDRSAYGRLWDAVDGDGAFASMYLSENFIDDIGRAAAQGSGTDLGSIPSGAVLATARLDDDGIEFAGASIAITEGGDAEPGTWWRTLPAGTYGYISVALPFDRADIDALYDEQVRAIRDLGFDDDVDVFLDDFEVAFGVSVRDLLRQFGGELLFAAIESDFGPLPALTGGPLGLGLAIGVEDEAVVRDALAAIPDLLGPDGDAIARTAEGLWVIDFGDGEILTFGVTEGRLVIASDDMTVDAVTGKTDGAITDDPEWQRLADLLDEDMALYVDIARVVARFAPTDVARDLAPLRSMGAAGELVDGVSIVRLRIVVDY